MCVVCSPWWTQASFRSVVHFYSLTTINLNFKIEPGAVPRFGIQNDTDCVSETKGAIVGVREGEVEGTHASPRRGVGNGEGGAVSRPRVSAPGAHRSDGQGLPLTRSPRRFGASPKTPPNVSRCAAEGVLTGRVTVRYGGRRVGRGECTGSGVSCREA